MDDSPGYPTKSKCVFHPYSRTSGFCCIAAADPRARHATPSRPFLELSPHNRPYLPGIDFPNTVTTEIDCPRSDNQRRKQSFSKSPVSLSRNSQHSSHMKSHSSSEDIEVQGGKKMSENGITVSYDVWRTVEEVTSPARTKLRGMEIP